MYIHGKMIDEVDWTRALDAKRVILCVPLAVITELDKHKRDTRNQRRRDRGKKVSRLLEQLLREPRTPAALPGRRGVMVQAITIRPDMTEYPDLETSDADDRIIVTAKTLTREVSSPVVLLSDDLNLRVKARVIGLTAPDVAELPVPLMLPDEPTEAEREIRQLKSKLQAYERAQPDLSIVLETSGVEASSHVASYQGIRQPTDAEIKARVRAERKLLMLPPPKARPDPGSPGSAARLLGAAGLGLTVPSSIQVVEYNRKLEEIGRAHV